MSAPRIRSLGELMRVARDERQQPATWLNRAWRYQSAATHDDASAFRDRMREYARRAGREAEAAEAAKRG